MSIWDSIESLDKLEQQRAEKRITGGRLTFDCFNLKCKGDRAYCSKGLMLGQAKDGSIALITVLRGITSGACKKCSWFTTDEEGA